MGRSLNKRMFSSVLSAMVTFGAGFNKIHAGFDMSKHKQSIGSFMIFMGGGSFSDKAYRENLLNLIDDLENAGGDIKKAKFFGKRYINSRWLFEEASNAWKCGKGKFSLGKLQNSSELYLVAKLISFVFSKKYFLLEGDINNKLTVGECFRLLKSDNVTEFAKVFKGYGGGVVCAKGDDIVTLSSGECFTVNDIFGKRGDIVKLIDGPLDVYWAATEVVDIERNVLGYCKFIDQCCSVIKYGSGGIIAGATAITACSAALKVISQLAQTAEERRKDRIHQERKERAQKEYDDSMRKVFGSSSIDYKRDWQSVAGSFDALAVKSPHNKKAIGEIKSSISGFYLNNKDRFEKGSKDGSALLLSISGSPGCGKTSFCLDAARALGAEKPVIIGPPDFDVGDKQLSVRKQVSGKWNMGQDDRGYLAYGKLVAALTLNEHPVIIMDELDKLPQDVVNMVWDAADTGRVTIDGRDVVCKGAIFLFPANKPLASNSYKKSDAAMREKSIASRVKQFKFNTPDKGAYKVAIERILEDVKVWADSRGISFQCTSKEVSNMAEMCVKLDRGMRSISRIKELMMSFVEENIEKNKGGGVVFTSKTLQDMLGDEYKVAAIYPPPPAK